MSYLRGLGVSALPPDSPTIPDCIQKRQELLAADGYRVESGDDRANERLDLIARDIVVALDPFDRSIDRRSAGGS